MTTAVPASSIPDMPWTPDTKSAAVLEQIITRAQAQAITGFRQAEGWRPVGNRRLVKARAIIREFGRVTVSELVDALRNISGGSIPLETLGWVGLVMTVEIEQLVKTLGRQMSKVRTTVTITGAIERLQGARGDATLDVERQLGKAALWAPPGDHRARRRR
jgi:hypothetical protein